jgi:hypothetical protein
MTIAVMDFSPATEELRPLAADETGLRLSGDKDLNHVGAQGGHAL